MIIYLSMLLIVFCGYVLYHIIKIDENPNKRPSKLSVICVFGYIIFWVGMRDAFVDTSAYIRMFQSCSMANLSNLDFSWGSDWGFEVIQILFKTFISSNYHVWLMFIAIITGSCIAVTFYRYCINFYYSLFLFISTTTFFWMMNGIRQFLVVSIIFACTPLIEKKKWVCYSLIVLFCSTIHGSCIIMIPIYFIVQGKAWSRKTLFLIVIALLVCVGSARFTNVLDMVLNDTRYGGVSEKFAVDDGINPLRVLVYSVTTIIAFCGRKIDKEKDSSINILINMSIITSCLYLIGMTTSGILIGRLPIYTQMYQFILLPYLFEKCFTVESKKILYLGSVVCFLFYFYLMTRGVYYSSEFTGRIY